MTACLGGVVAGEAQQARHAVRGLPHVPLKPLDHLLRVKSQVLTSSV